MELPRLDGLHVLFVDDRRDARFVVDHILRDAGAFVTTFENGQLACEAVTSRYTTGKCPYHVIVMDINMPVLDGLAATRRLRQQGCRVPILALTAAPTEHDRRECLEAGCDDYLSKPLDGARLVDLVHTLALAHGAI